MTGVRRAALAALAAASALLVAVAPGGDGTAPPARHLELQSIAAQPANRAAVIVDKGDGSAPKKVCIRFDANSVTGEEALRLAAEQDPSIAPVFSDFSGKGKAVCALCGVGCPSGDCFCDPQRYWAYSRAEAGSSTFQASPVGVSSSEVTDGDVEGYRWGSGVAPAYADIQTICGEVAPEPTTTPTTTSTTAAPAQPPPNRSEPPPAALGPALGDQAVAPSADPTTTGTGPAADATQTTTTAAPTDTDDGATDEDDDTSATDDGDGDDDGAASVRLTQDGEAGAGGSMLALAGVGATFLALVGGAVALQRTRRPR